MTIQKEKLKFLIFVSNSKSQSFWDLCIFKYLKVLILKVDLVIDGENSQIDLLIVSLNISVELFLILGVEWDASGELGTFES